MREMLKVFKILVAIKDTRVKVNSPLGRERNERGRETGKEGANKNWQRLFSEVKL